MTKRSSAGDWAVASPSKRQYFGGGESSFIDMEDQDDDFTTVQTPSSIADADSPGTAATTPRAKFPSDLKTLACTWAGCPKTFNRPARLRDHLNSHTNSRPFACPYDECDKDYIEDKHLKQHIKAVHTHERKHVCQKEGCGKSFVTGTRLKRHQAVHEGADRFRCQDCGQSFRKRETLNKHVRKDHRGLAPHQCPEPSCEEAFDSKPALKRHREREHGEVKYWCGECALKTLEDGLDHKVGFTTEALLNVHMKREHQNCMFCEFKSASKWELDAHVEMHHSGKTVEDRKTEACPYPNCQKKFTKKSNLNVHVRTAHEGFRFVCGELELSGPLFHDWSKANGCGDKFSTKIRLEDHVRFIHLGHERPKLSKTDGPSHADDIFNEISGFTNQTKQSISCPHCSEAFIRYHDLDLHLHQFHSSNLDANTIDPAAFLSTHQIAFGAQPAFDQDFGPAAWPDDMPQEEIFSAQMDYGPQRDEWLDDEANMMLLARETSELGVRVDPTLGDL